MRTPKYQRFARGLTKRGVMNKTEQRYADTLRARSMNGDVLWFAYEAIKLRLADNTFYTPDFFVMRGDGTLECHEVKGYWDDKARVKTKVAADKFPLKFIAIKWAKGQWSEEVFCE